MAICDARLFGIFGVATGCLLFFPVSHFIVGLSFGSFVGGNLGAPAVLEVRFTAIFNVKMGVAKRILTPMTAKPLLLGCLGTLSSCIFDLFDVDAN